MAKLNKKQLEAKIKALKAEQAVKADMLKQERQLAYYASDRAIVDTIRSEAIAKLNEILESLTVAYSTQYDLDSEKRQKYISTFGYTTLLDKVITIATATKFLTKDLKEAILVEFNLDELLIDDLINAVGKPAYYSKVDHNVVEEIPYNNEAVEACLARLSIALDIDLTTETMSTTVLHTMYKRANNSALAMYNNTEAIRIESEYLDNNDVEYTE
jgi:hypothetical protein